MKRKRLSPKEAAELLQIDARTVINWLRAGFLEGTQNPLSGRWNVSKASVSRLLRRATRRRKARGRNGITNRRRD
jgi:predicted site-specific integrase-resolvase